MTSLKVLSIDQTPVRVGREDMRLAVVAPGEDGGWTMATWDGHTPAHSGPTPSIVRLRR